MQHAASFAQVLDETLAGCMGTAEADRPARTYRAPQVLGFFDFSAPGPQPSPWPRRAPAPPPAPRVRRALTPWQRIALDELVALGADLSADFTQAELRTAFRGLARQYHPDRFAASSDSEKARLSRLFARAHGAYRTLHTSLAHAA
jgi:hypothetical protein